MPCSPTLHANLPSVRVLYAHVLFFTRVLHRTYLLPSAVTRRRVGKVPATFRPACPRGYPRTLFRSCTFLNPHHQGTLTPSTKGARIFSIL
jgi:hypothetical protein